MLRRPLPCHPRRCLDAHHSPLFYLDEGSLPVGLRALLGVTVDYLQGVKPD